LLRASAYIYVPEHAAYNPFHLVFSVENEEGVYVYQSVDSNPEDIKTGEWNEIRMAAETKEIKSPGDIMKLYVWYSGKREVIVDDFTVEFF